MKFYNREEELKKLHQIEKLSKSSSKMSIIIGRRRIGKTSLIKKAYEQKVYLFVSKKSEALLCEEFISIIEKELDVKVLGEYYSFTKLFEYLLDLAKERHFTLVVDEFQEFLSINKTIYSDLQNLWDSYKDITKLNLVLSGSIYSLMKKIFEDKKEPLFNRADLKIHLKPFTVITLQEILKENYPKYTNEDLLSFYTITGGVAKYVELFVTFEAFTLQKQLDLIYEENSLFLEEGKNILVEEFGKEYTTYFSILSLIAAGKTARAEMESILQKDVGGYLERLEREYSVIKRVKPIFAKEGSRVLKYEIVDNFFSFWFRFIYKYRSTIEIENYEYVKNIAKRDFSTYSGKFLEKYFTQKLKLTHQYSQIGNYWERGNQNEIDIVAVNEEEKTMLIAEVKINPKKISIKKLEEKSKKLIDKFQNYKVDFKGFSLNDI
jgi:AAA+ ATPase superfamily predicted ATPase